MTAHIESLSFAQPSQRTYELARLILLEIDYQGLTYQAPDDAQIMRYVARESQNDAEYYACIEDDQQGSLVGGARARHTLPQGTTTLEAIAVHPDSRGQKYGRMLLQYVAMEAQRHGNARIQVGTFNPAFFKHFGFVEELPITPSLQYMEADVATVLSL